MFDFTYGIMVGVVIVSVFALIGFVWAYIEKRKSEKAMGEDISPTTFLFIMGAVFTGIMLIGFGFAFF